ncbi:MAG TPA: PKD domain-containing protein, partial [Cyclobacteriaceae bacterium]|nr:PKD domain-containing protein [Cyclobacteriaceae bacterium]
VYSGANATISVDYNSPGLKYVTLTAVNTSKSSCVATKSTTVNVVRPPLSGDFKVTPLVACLPVDLVVDNNIVGGDTFEWTLSEKFRGIVSTATGFEPTLKISNSGEYELQLVVMLNGSPNNYTSKKITIYELPLVGFLANPSIVSVPDMAVHFVNQTKGANTYSWDFGDNTSSQEQQPVHAYLKAGDYVITLNASNDYGDFDINDDGQLVNVTCSNFATQTVKAVEGGSALIPNAFTPNRGGPGSASNDPSSNDFFLPLTKGVEKFEMEVYDRWGSLIFLSKDKTQGWDGYDRNGNLLPTGVYVYKLTLTLSNGQRTTQVGDVTLLR